jgi:hypothetical protein
MKVAAALLQIRLLRQMTGGDEAGMPPAMAAALRDCGGAAGTSLPGAGMRRTGSHGMYGTFR